MIPIALNVPILTRAAGSTPSANVLVNLSGRIDSYQHTISATFGFESMTVEFASTVDEAANILSTWLGCSTVVTGPEAQIVWEGVLVGIEASFGQEQRSLSIDALANRVRCKYTTVLGTPGVTSTVSDTTSINTYGTKDLVVSLNATDATSAANEAAIQLASMKNPRAVPQSTAATGEMGDVRISLTFAGWYATLDWLVTSNSTTSTAVTTTQVQTLISSYVGTNVFFSTDYTNITASGISSPQLIEGETTYREAIEARLKLGNGTNRYAWGVFEGRKFYAGPWAGATPRSVTYYRRLGSGNITDSSGRIVAPWDVRPNANIEVNDILDPAPLSTVADSVWHYYVERVTCSVGKDSVECALEPAAFDSAEARLWKLTKATL